MMAWPDVRLVVFDVDGTLYSQRSMRVKMLLELLAALMTTGNMTALRVLRSYRAHREEIGAAELDDFEVKLLTATARSAGCDSRMVSSVVEEWIERRPLKHIRGCMYTGVHEIFWALKRQDKTIAILSDYPAAEKMQAMGLNADIIVAASDPRVKILKPSPRGLDLIINEAGVHPSETVFIGDRVDRDGAVARRVGVFPLIRSARAIDGWSCFQSYGDPVFADLLASSGVVDDCSCS